MKWQYLFLFLLICSGCSQGSSYHNFKLSEKQKIVNKLRKRVASDLQSQYGLIPFGTGGQMMYQVQKLMLIFNYPRQLTEEEARILVVNATEEFLTAINEEVLLRQYLANYPFEPKNVEITIFLQDSRGTSIQPEKFLVIKAADGFVTCMAKTPGTHDYRTVFKETFDEAKLKTLEKL